MFLPDTRPVTAGNRWVVDVADASDLSLCGGKAVGLRILQRAGCNVPAAICLTTEFYRWWFRRPGVAAPLIHGVAQAATREPARRADVLERMRERVVAEPLPDELMRALLDGLASLHEGWLGPLCVRAAAPFEDVPDGRPSMHPSFVVTVGHVDAVVAAIKACWASLWAEPAWTYRQRRGLPHAGAAIAVLVQRFVSADRSGVAFSVDPMTGDRGTVVLEASWGSSTDLVSGDVTPDEYRVRVDYGATVIERHAGRQDQMTLWPDGRPIVVPVPRGRHCHPVLDESQALELVRVAKAAEHTLGAPASVDWAFEGGRCWTVRVRPVAARARRRDDVPEPGTTWTRANLREVFPELPSPLALSYLSLALNAQGYPLSANARLVWVFRGRPYLNLSLMQRLTVERGADPAVLGRLFGARAAPTPPAAVSPTLESGRTVRRVRVLREIVPTFIRTPGRGRRLLRAMRREAATLRAVALDRLDDRTLVEHLRRFRTLVLRERTMQGLHEVISAPSRAYMALEALLAASIGADAEKLVKRVMIGVGILPDVQMARQLMALGACALAEAPVRAFFDCALDAAAVAGYRTALVGTRFLAEFDAFLRAFGHRGPHESDVMSPRFAEDPTPAIRVIQLHVRARARPDPVRDAGERAPGRPDAAAEVRRALRRAHGHFAFATRWAAFSIMRRSLQRLLALHDESHDVTTLLVAHLRALALEIGRRATLRGRLESAEQVFFLSWDELPDLLVESRRPWPSIVRGRLRNRARHNRQEAPSLLRGDPQTSGDDSEPTDPADELDGLGVSPGIVTGTVKIVRAPVDIADVAGCIAVFPSIEPTVTAIFPLLRGLIADLGGLLSRGAILAREYGLPAVLDVPDATRRLRDGDRVEIDGATGRIRIIERAA